MKGNTKILVIVLVGLIIVLAIFFIKSGDQFEIPKGETISINEADENMKTSKSNSSREIFVTDGVRHSIPLSEILSGGPPKDGIPSIDDPKFISVDEADDTLNDDDVGLGLIINSDVRFYPYDVLVWHEIVNDTVGDKPVLVTYCPLCRTGVVFDRSVDGETQEFGVSGRLWKSNLLMYNRTGSEETESLWSQILGEAVLGPVTGERLGVISSDTVLYGDWKKEHPDTSILSRDTGAFRTYGIDPYGDYYTNNTVAFGASFSDDRLHPKAFVFGIEINGKYKAYDNEAIPQGTITDTFEGETITIQKDTIGGVRMSVDGEPLEYISGFWFSWLAVHSMTELFSK